MMTMPEIERCLRQLRLSGVRDTLQTRVLQAQGANQPFLETFSLILQDELDRRQSRLIERRYQQSGLDEKLTLAEFDWSFNPKLPRQTCFQLHTLVARTLCLLANLAPGSRTSPRRLPIRRSCKATRSSILRPTTSSTATP
ncbi:hypothetical protein ACVIW2_000055 [Bradyrhizobium huanghuaihaiense]